MTDLERMLLRLVEVLEVRDPAALHRPITVADLRERILPYRFSRNAIGLTSSEDYELLVLRLVAEEGGYVRVFPPDSAEAARTETGSPNPNIDLVEAFDDTTFEFGAEGLGRLLALRLAEPGSPAPDGPALDRPSEAAAGDDRPRSGPSRPSAAAARPSAASTDPGPDQLDPSLEFEFRAESEPVPEPAEPAVEERFEPLADSVTVETLAGDGETGSGGEGSGSPPVAACPSCAAALPAHRPVTFCPYCGLQVDARRCARCGSEIEPGWRHCVACGHQVASDRFA